MRAKRDTIHILGRGNRTLAVVVHAACSTPPKVGLSKVTGGRKPRGEGKGGVRDYSHQSRR
jgi:hypothetical protein